MSKKFIISSAVFFLYCGLFLLSLLLLGDKNPLPALVFWLNFPLPFLCLRLCMPNTDDFSWHGNMLIAMFILEGIVAFCLYYFLGTVMYSNPKGTLLSIISIYLLWALIGYIIRTKKYFKAYWFGIGGVNVVLATMYFLNTNGEM